MNPLFTLGEEFRFHDSSRFRKKARDAKFRFYHSFVPVLMSLAAESCRSRAESVHLLKPYLQWGKGWKSSNFVTPDDSARNRKMRKMMSLNCSICLMPIFGLGKVYRIWTPKAVLPSCVESLLLKQNPTLIYLRNVKSFVFRAGRKVPRFHTAKMGLPRATTFRFGQGHFEAVFNFYFNSRRDQKWARQIHALERVAILFLGLRHDARNAPSCCKSSPETMKPQKAGRMTQTSTCWTGEDHFLESKKPMCLRPRKWDCCSDLFCEKWRSFNKKQYSCKCNGMAGFRGTRLLIEGL